MNRGGYEGSRVWKEKFFILINYQGIIAKIKKEVVYL